MILKPRRTKMHSIKLNIQFDTNEMEQVNAYLKYQENVSSYGELAEIGILDLIKKDLIFMKKFNSGEFNSVEKSEDIPEKVVKPDDKE
jgi:hypothetical protein